MLICIMKIILPSEAVIRWFIGGTFGIVDAQ